MFNRKITIALAILALTGFAHATKPGDNGGGQGGAGGSAAAIAVAAQQQGQIQGQAQGQLQGQSQSSRNDNRSSSANTNVNANTNASVNRATGGAATATNQAMGGNGYSQSGGNVLYNTGGAMTVEGAKGDTYYAPAQERNPVATAYAAPLTATNGTCMGSSSAGGQGAAFGLSIGTTWTDSSCDIRYDAEALRAAGLPLAAQARLCQKADIAKAMEAAGTPCPGSKRAAAAPAVSTTVTDKSGVVQAQHTDPIVRQRLGLPPL